VIQRADIGLHRELVRRLDEEIDNVESGMSAGSPEDWVRYRSLVGYVRGMRFALDIAESIENEMMGKKTEGQE